MKIKLTIIFILVLTSSFSQTEITYEKVLTHILESKEILCTNLIIPNNDFNIGLYTSEWEVEDLTMEQCGDIETDSIKNIEILKILKSEKLLDKLYIQLENNNYESINSEDKFKWDEMSMIIDLSSSQEWDGLHQVYIPIKDKKYSKKLIKLISKIYDKDYCFRKLKRNL